MAAAHFATGGLAGTSTEAIAVAAGVSQPYLFRLFGTKKALFLATMLREYRRIHDTFAAAAEQAIAQGKDPFAAMGTAYLRLLEDRTGLLCQLQLYAACDDPEVRAACQQAWGELWTFLSGLPGATPERVREFLATGMLLNVAAAMDMVSLAAPWADSCLPSDAGDG